MGPDPFCRVLMKKKISLCERNVGRPARRDIKDSKGSQGYSSSIQQFKNLLFILYCSDKIKELRGYILPLCKRADKMARGQHHHTPRYYFSKKSGAEPVDK
jgi:hypothetical protein